MEEKIINIILFGGIAIICFIKYLTIIIRMRKYIKVKGKVIYTKESYIMSGDSVSKGAHNKYYFEHNGNSFEIEDKFWGGNPKLDVGDTVYCYISKKDKTKILAPEDIYYKNIYLIAVIIFKIIMFVFWKML